MGGRARLDADQGSRSVEAERLGETVPGNVHGDPRERQGRAEADSESVEELVEEGNAYEASIVDGVENAKDPDVSEVRTREVPEDDVPEEYRDDDDRVA